MTLHPADVAISPLPNGQPPQTPALLTTHLSAFPPVVLLVEAPDPAEALAIWDAVLPLARNGVFFELKRGRS